ncbi:hypothetical protein [Spiroplasma poulsonii]|nr:hypothetical protein [Spiroplasma poulsonii]UNF62186.1 hypothetical protein MNU24_01595 [Spiroplasma poulsonii]
MTRISDLFFILVKVLILVETNCYRNIKWIEDILIKRNSWFSTTCW